jgi:hypothetical protein
MQLGTDNIEPPIATTNQEQARQPPTIKYFLETTATAQLFLPKPQIL